MALKHILPAGVKSQFAGYWPRWAAAAQFVESWPSDENVKKRTSSKKRRSESDRRPPNDAYLPQETGTPVYLDLLGPRGFLGRGERRSEKLRLDSWLELGGGGVGHLLLRRLSRLHRHLLGADLRGI